MSLIQQVTPALLASQLVLPDKELNTMYRYVAFIRNSQQSPYVLQWQHRQNNKSHWLFISEENTCIYTVPAYSIKQAINNAINCGFTVYRITNSSL